MKIEKENEVVFLSLYIYYVHHRQQLIHRLIEYLDGGRFLIYRVMVQIRIHLLHVRTQSRKLQYPHCYASIATNQKLDMSYILTRMNA